MQLRYGQSLIGWLLRLAPSLSWRTLRIDSCVGQEGGGRVAPPIPQMVQKNYKKITLWLGSKSLIYGQPNLMHSVNMFWALNR